MANNLEFPSTPDDLYFARGVEVDCFRPFMQGDVFSGVDIPGVEADEGDEGRLAMIVTHPCSMRRGPRLVPHIHAVRVKRWANPIPFEEWSSSFFRIMPLPALIIGEKGTTYAAVFETMGRIRSDQLRYDARIACLSNEGIILLQQRIVHNLTRVVVPKRQLFDHVQHILDEAELQEEWTWTLLGELPEKEVLPRLESEIKRFDIFLGQRPEGGSSLRDDLKNPERRALVRRTVRAEIRRRKTETENGETLVEDEGASH